MTYSYNDSAGYLGAGPSIGGAKALFEELAKVSHLQTYPNLNHLLETGMCANTDSLRGEVLRLLKKIKDPDVKDTLQRLARAAAIAKGTITVTH